MFSADELMKLWNNWILIVITFLWPNRIIHAELIRLSFYEVQTETITQFAFFNSLNKKWCDIIIWLKTRLDFCDVRSIHWFINILHVSFGYRLIQF